MVSRRWKGAAMAFLIVLPVLPGCAATGSGQSAALTRSTDSGGGAEKIFPIIDAEAGPTRNAVISPVSIDLAFGLLHAGARGETRAQLEKILPPPALPLEFESDEQDVRVSISNALFLDRRFRFQSAYLDEVRATYDANAIGVDFREKQASADTINGWADEATEGLIPTVIAPSQIKESMIAVLGNALYFEGLWQTKLERGGKMPFLFGSGENRDFTFMGKVLTIPHARHREWEAIRLPYRNPRYVMDVIIPSERVVMETAPSLRTIERIKRKLDDDEGQLVSLAMPEFESDFAESIKKPLQAIGLTSPFGDATTDLSGITVPGQGTPAVNDVRHFTKLQVFDEGTKAAAVTTLGIVVVSGRRYKTPPIRFEADRPFLVVLRDLERDAMLFIGRIADPKPYEPEDGAD